MKKSQFAQTQILAAIQKQEKGIAVKDIVRESRVSEQTFHNWKPKYGGMQVIGIKKIRDMG